MMKTSTPLSGHDLVPVRCSLRTSPPSTSYKAVSESLPSNTRNRSIVDEKEDGERRGNPLSFLFPKFRVELSKL